MAAKSTRLQRLLAALERHHGAPEPPHVTDPFEQVLLEQVAYLASDEKRVTAFERLRKEVGLEPAAIAAAPLARLEAIARSGGGTAPALRAERMRQSAERVLGEWGGDLSAVLALPKARAVKALAAFPSIGRPGAEAILAKAGGEAGLPLDSNALRTLLRLGYGDEGETHASTHRSAQAAAEAEAPRDAAGLLAAHLLLRHHGRTTCRRRDPLCGSCPLQELCPSAGTG